MLGTSQIFECKISRDNGIALIKK
ncbi:hypothetical protein [Flavobacterium collinsii]